MAKFTKGNTAAVGRSKKTTFLSRLREASDPHWDEMLKSVIDQARAGDTAAFQLIASRIAPTYKQVLPTVDLGLPDDATLEDRAKAIGVASVAGTLSADHAKALLEVIQLEIQLSQVEALEQRIAALEQRRA